MWQSVIFFSNQISDWDVLIQKMLDNPSENCKVSIKGILQPQHLVRLNSLLEQLPPAHQISIDVDLSLLTNPLFSEAMVQLNSKPLCRVEWFFSEAEINKKSKEISEFLNQNCSLAAAFPINIKQYTESGSKLSALNLESFQRHIIENIQKKHKNPKDFVSQNSVLGTVSSDPQGKKIKLKELLFSKKTGHNDKAVLGSAIPIEVQHVESIQQEIAQQEVVEMQLNTQLYETLPYDGVLVGYDAFNQPEYRQRVQDHTGNDKTTQALYEELKTELFGNLPHAIKFVSPEAATRLADQLPALLSLNKENLPHGFLLKKTPQGEFVLDYDSYAENPHADEYTPFVVAIDETAYYPLNFKKEHVQFWISESGFFQERGPGWGALWSSTQLTNLWIQYGDEGVVSFLKTFKSKTQASPELALFIVQHYMVYVPQWTSLNKPEFWEAIERISHWSHEKQTCLKRFLEKTGASCHDLHKTVQGFEVFWQDLSIRCASQNVSIRLINKAQWSTPVAGNPLVYIERMHHIVKNARHLADQLQGLDGLTLRHYDAYYASRYEGYVSVSKEMLLAYSYKRQVKKAFNPHYKLYPADFVEYVTEYADIERFIRFKHYMNDRAIRAVDPEKTAAYDAKRKPLVEWDDIPDDYIPDDWGTEEEKNSEFWLVNSAVPITPKTTIDELKEKGVVQSFFAGQFNPPHNKIYASLPDGRIKMLFDKIPRRYGADIDYALGYRFIGKQSSGIRVDQMRAELGALFGNFVGKGSEDALAAPFLTTLFFVTHERYLSGVSLSQLIKQLYYSKGHEVFSSTMHLLTKLYRLDIKLNQTEGLIIVSSMAGMNSCEFESLNLNKASSIAQLLEHLEHHKFATFKYLNFRAKECSDKWPLIFALDSAKFWSKDPLIASYYHDDLLLFAGMINSKIDESYAHEWYGTPEGREKNNAEKILSNMEQVQLYLHQAAELPKPNNLQYAVQSLLYAKKFFRYDSFLTACSAITALTEFDSSKVNEILSESGLYRGASAPELMLEDASDLKHLIIELILTLELQQGLETEELQQVLETEALILRMKSLSELQARLNAVWSKSAASFTVANKIILDKIIKTYKEQSIREAFGLPEAKGVFAIFGGIFSDLIDFKNVENFEQVNILRASAEKTAQMLRQIMNNPHMKERGEECSEWLKKWDFARMEYASLYAVLHLFSQMPDRDIMPLLKECAENPNLLNDKTKVLYWVTKIGLLNQSGLPSRYVEICAQLLIANPPSEAIDVVMGEVIAVFERDHQDPLLEFVMEGASNRTLVDNNRILNHSKKLNLHRDKLKDLWGHLERAHQLSYFLEALDASGEVIKTKVLEVLSLAYSLNKSKESLDYHELITLLLALPTESLNELYLFYQSSPVSASCLLNALKQPQKYQNFQDFLHQFEKAPFGSRPLDVQFSTSEVERVVNKSQDLLNNSVYTRQYRKQWMEAFLFVNQIGYDLPIFAGKSAKDLSNEALKQHFLDVKLKKQSGLDPFQYRLIALALMREAMYRSTGQFPYSTQMLALIDGMMHQGDFISNIDTGQGKSLIDVMKATLLWLESDRVELTTSSLVDAKRDIANYGAFLKLLGVPCSESPIASTSPLSDFKTDGINFSTAAQLSLFYSRAQIVGHALDSDDSVVSLVLNESDHALLDDRVIYRFATTDGALIGPGEEWMYTAINDFVGSADFLNHQETSAKEDIQALKSYLKAKALELKKSPKMLGKYTDEIYLSWIESALTANHVLVENKDYVVSETFEKKTINGNTVDTRLAKVLMKDGKVSPDSVFGNGIQQFLHARLNKITQSSDFVIEPEHKTILSSNNKNLIDKYRAHKGFIWGSSGTVGSQREIQEQYQKYGFEVSKTEPHQKNKVQLHPSLMEADEAAQFAKILQKLTEFFAKTPDVPHVVFLKDIETTTRFYQFLQNRLPQAAGIQLYTGLGQEEVVIKKASMPGMITVSTSAIGRNTDIAYDRSKGLCVWHGCVDSIRAMGQKSGRTGRQGSVGQVMTVLNAHDLDGKSMQTVQEHWDEMASIERHSNEAYYDLMGALFARAHAQNADLFAQGKTAFIRNDWAGFSLLAEKQHREWLINQTISWPAFVQNTLDQFNALMQKALKTPLAPLHLDECLKQLAEKGRLKEAYVVQDNTLRMTDCTPSVSIAYHLLSSDLSVSEPAATKLSIKEQLKNTCSGLNKKNWMEKNTAYLNYLVATPKTQALVVEAHQEFLREYLKPETALSSRQQLWNQTKRWLGFESRLSQISGHNEYLMMFHALTQVGERPEDELKLIKDSVGSLLDDYLDCWFVNQQRKEWASALKEQIGAANTMDELIQRLSSAQIQTAKEDIQTNKTRFFKPLHASGNSRYQNTLSKALNLASALSGRTNAADPLIKELSPLLSETTDKVPLTEVSSDALEAKARSKKSDSSNASVLNKSIEQALNIKHRGSLKTMLGRARKDEMGDISPEFADAPTPKK